MVTNTLVKNTINEMVENNTLSVETLTQTLTEQGIENKVEESNGKWGVYFKNESSSDDNISITHLEFEI